MSSFEKSYVIVKILQNKKGKPQHVLLIDVDNEILEFNDRNQAEKIANIFEMNSEQGFTYYVREI
jgi:predicted HAD superfamily phosphohydrolase YqeG